MRNINKLLEVLEGRHTWVQYYGDQHWQQTVSNTSELSAQKPTLRPKAGSRDERRNVPRNLWARSE